MRARRENRRSRRRRVRTGRRVGLTEIFVLPTGGVEGFVTSAQASRARTTACSNSSRVLANRYGLARGALVATRVGFAEGAASHRIALQQETLDSLCVVSWQEHHRWPPRFGQPTAELRGFSLCCWRWRPLRSHGGCSVLREPASTTPTSCSSTLTTSRAEPDSSTPPEGRASRARARSCGRRSVRWPAALSRIQNRFFSR